MNESPKISIIVAVAANNAIGRDGDLLFRIKPDMKHFRQLTMGHPVVMGRRTWESLGRALPGRRNVVISRNENYRAEGAEVVSSLNEAFRLLGNDTGGEIFIIGGEQIYRQSLEVANRLYITEIDARCDDADVFFPEIDRDIWKESPFPEASRTNDYAPHSGWQTDPATKIRYRFICLTRK